VGGNENMRTTQPSLNKLRKNKFRLILTIPNILKNIESKTVRDNDFINTDSIQFSIYNVEIPEVQVPEVPVHVYGQNLNVTSYDRPAYAPVTINFEVDNEFKNYWVIWKWLSLLNDPQDSHPYAGKETFPNGKPDSIIEDDLWDYQTTIIVEVLDEYNNKQAVVKYTNAFPTKLGRLDYNYRDADQLSCYFTFVFNQLDIDLVE
jgi:hypothetical protein